MEATLSQDFPQEAGGPYLNGTGLTDQSPTTDVSTELLGKGFMIFLFPAQIPRGKLTHHFGFRAFKYRKTFVTNRMADVRVAGDKSTIKR